VNALGLPVRRVLEPPLAVPLDGAQHHGHVVAVPARADALPLPTQERLVASTMPVSRRSFSSRMARRMRWQRYQAVLQETPSIRLSWFVETLLVDWHMM